MKRIETMESKTNYGLALLKMLMCFEVILIHFWDISDYPFILTPFVLLRDYAVPVFMLISFICGQKLFERLELQNVKSRLWRLFWPQLAWAIIYWSVYNLVYILWGIGNKHDLNSLLWQIATGHSKELNPSMWYTTVLIGLTILFYVIWYYQKGIKGIIVMCMLLAVSLILQYTQINLLLFDKLRYEMKYPLGRTVELLPYAVIGFMIMHYKVYGNLDNQRYKVLSCTLALFLGGFLVRNRICKIEGFNYAGVYLIVMSVLITTIAYYIPIDKVPEKLKKSISYVTRYTLGIYCMHRLVGSYISRVFDQIGLEKGTFFMCIVTYILCYVISIIISCIPVKCIRQLVK